MRGLLPLLIPALLLIGRPASAGARISLHLENATLHQALRQLHASTGLQFNCESGAGQEGYREAPGEKRVRLEWREAPLAHVIRELCDRFGLSASAMGESGYWFQPGALPRRSEVVLSGVGFSIGTISQSEGVLLVPGDTPARTVRSLNLQLICRALNGEGEIIGSLSRLRLIDDAGRVREGVSPAVSFSYSALPDERYRTVAAAWEGTHAPRLRAIEGDLQLYERADEHHVSLPLHQPASAAPIQRQLGAAELTIHRLSLARERGLELKLRLEWPETADVTHQGTGAMRVSARLSNGRLQRLYGGMRPGTAENGRRFLECDYQNQFEAPPVSLELHVPVRSGAGRRLAFRLENIALPHGRPLVVQEAPVRRPASAAKGSPPGPVLPRALADPQGGGTLLVPAPGAGTGRVEEAAVGLSRRNADGSWTSPRWIQLKLETNPFSLHGLAPGTYRVQIRRWKKLPDGSSQPAGPPGPAREVTIRRGTATRL